MKTQFPYFVLTPIRILDTKEFALVTKLLEGQDELYRNQLQSLRVVGRCGCGQCPTIFFQAHEVGAPVSDLVFVHGCDSSGGSTGVALRIKNHQLCELDVCSLDGHSSLSLPDPETLHVIEKIRP